MPGPETVPLRVLYGKRQRKPLVINQRRFSPQAVGTALACLRDPIIQMGEGKISHPRALSPAREIESSVIEKRFCDVLSGESEERKEVFRTLEMSTRSIGIDSRHWQPIAADRELGSGPH